MVVAAITAVCGCRRGPRPDWDRAAFALELVRDEYPELVESGDFRGVPALLAVLDGARAGLGAPDRSNPRARRRAHRAPRRPVSPRRPAGRGQGQCSPAGHAGREARPAPLADRTPRSRAGRGDLRARLRPLPRSPRGPPPPTAAHMVPPPTRPTASVLTPYELFNRVTYGGAGTAMPSFSESLPEDRPWDVAFYLFADRWPAANRQTAPRAVRRRAGRPQRLRSLAALRLGLRPLPSSGFPLSGRSGGETANLRVRSFPCWAW